MDPQTNEVLKIAWMNVFEEGCRLAQLGKNPQALLLLDLCRDFGHTATELVKAQEAAKS